jgi:hypothetical protein
MCDIATNLKFEIEIENLLTLKDSFKKRFCGISPKIK